MRSFEITVSDSLEAFVEGQARAKGVLPEDFVRGLIEDARFRSRDTVVGRLVVEGLESGADQEEDDQFWSDLRTETVIMADAAQRRQSA